MEVICILSIVVAIVAIVFVMVTRNTNQSNNTPTHKETPPQPQPISIVDIKEHLRKSEPYLKEDLSPYIFAPNEVSVQKEMHKMQMEMRDNIPLNEQFGITDFSDKKMKEYFGNRFTYYKRLSKEGMKFLAKTYKYLLIIPNPTLVGEKKYLPPRIICSNEPFSLAQVKSSHSFEVFYDENGNVQQFVSELLYLGTLRKKVNDNKLGECYFIEN